MCSVWLCIPSKRPAEEAELVLKLWRERGYKIALAVDDAADANAKLPMSDLCISSNDGYRGYSASVNALAKFVLRQDPECQWVVAGGDDIEPDSTHSAEEIARQCCVHFENDYWKRAHYIGFLDSDDRGRVQTFGVMQPTGDRFAQGSIDRICGSPWLGRSFCERINQGKGPFWPDYTHCFGDEELQNVALKYGILWQRPDLIHFHRHWQREDMTDLHSNAVPKPMPEFLREANSREHWDKYKRLFWERKRDGFPGSEPL